MTCHAEIPELAENMLVQVTEAKCVHISRNTGIAWVWFSEIILFHPNREILWSCYSQKKVMISFHYTFKAPFFLIQWCQFVVVVCGREGLDEYLLLIVHFVQIKLAEQL